jgi:hypothetical protein
MHELMNEQLVLLLLFRREKAEGIGRRKRVMETAYDFNNRG